MTETPEKMEPLFSDPVEITSYSSDNPGEKIKYYFYFFVDDEQQCKIDGHKASKQPNPDNALTVEEYIFRYRYLLLDMDFQDQCRIITFYAHEIFNKIKKFYDDEIKNRGDELTALTLTEKKNALLKNLCFLVEETAFKSLTKPYIVEEIIYKTWHYSDKKLFRSYLELCMDSSRASWFLEVKNFEHLEAGNCLPEANREQEIITIVFEDCGSVREVIKSDPSVHEKIKRWFLSCYDLRHLKQFEKGIGPAAQGFSKKDLLTRILHFPGKTWRLLTVFTVNYNFLRFLIILSFLLAILFCRNVYTPVQMKNDLFLRCRLIALVSVVWFTIFWILKNLDEISTLFRLMGCILAGYFAVYSDEAWTGVIYLNQYNSIIEYILRMTMRWFIPGLFTYIYLHREIYNKVRLNLADDHDLKKMVIAKTTNFLFQTIFYTLIIGVILSDFTWSGMARHQLAKGINVIHTPFLMGSIFPEFILSQAPLAMFIGIF